MGWPPISCVCVTYGRPQRILEEAVYSFLQQDYGGSKELLILNDFSRQTIVFDHPEVTVINAPARFASLGEKRNAAAALCRYDFQAVWDDDDIFLPHRLTFSMSRYDPARRFFKARQAFVLNRDLLIGPKTWGFHSAALWHRSLFEEAGLYAAIDSGEDHDLEMRFKAIVGPGLYYDCIEPGEIYYIYRWAGTGSFHLSAFGRGPAGHQRVEQFVSQQLARGEILPGEIRLQPQWNADYLRLVRRHLTLGATPPSDPFVTPVERAGTLPAALRLPEE
ncbi:MAG TPA: glycosyltransferase family A protein [Bryobacteraceae bacterium]|nr:glycosyltransferase family A protein [Bryobacteraceae bacterium]